MNYDNLTKQELIVLVFELQEKLNTDKLTKVSTREVLQHHIDNLNERDIIIIDIDNFKYINDTYGHLIGDEVLKITAMRLANEIKSSDIIGRFGGEEFIIIPNGRATNEFMDRLIKCISDDKFNITLDDKQYMLDVSISAGVSDNLATADERLYKAKSNGKNQWI